ncbi:ash family protein [Salmonella enterica]|nr:ash family protein [Salmonella enterica]
MTTYKNRLLQSALMGYISPAPHKTGAGILNPKESTKRTTARAVFLRATHCHIFALWRGVQGRFRAGRVSLLTGVENPVRLATPEILNSGGELLNINKGAISWPTANSAVPTLTFSASVPRPKSTADCTAPAISRSSCRLTCCTKRARHSCRLTLPPSSAIWLTTCANCNASPALAGNPSTRPGSSGAFVHPVNREVCP